MIAVPAGIFPVIKTTPPLVFLFSTLISSCTSRFRRLEKALLTFLLAFDSSSVKVLIFVSSQPIFCNSSRIVLICSRSSCRKCRDSWASFSSSLNCFRFLSEIPTSKIVCGSSFSGNSPSGICLFPDLVKSEKRYVDVELNGELTRGMTVVDRRGRTPLGEENMNVALEVDAKRFKTQLMESLLTWVREGWVSLCTKNKLIGFFRN